MIVDGGCILNVSSGAAHAEAERTFKLCFGDNAPRNLVELFSNK
jgi:hypothetical protein